MNFIDSHQLIQLSDLKYLYKVNEVSEWKKREDKEASEDGRYKEAYRMKAVGKFGSPC